MARRTGRVGANAAKLEAEAVVPHAVFHVDGGSLLWVACDVWAQMCRIGTGINMPFSSVQTHRVAARWQALVVVGLRIAAVAMRMHCGSSVAD